MSQGDLTKKIAESSGLKPKEVKGVLAALAAIATAEVKKTEKFVIPQVAMLKLKHKPARKAGNVHRCSEVVVLPRPYFADRTCAHVSVLQQTPIGVVRLWFCRDRTSLTVHVRT